MKTLEELISNIWHVKYNYDEMKPIDAWGGRALEDDLWCYQNDRTNIEARLFESTLRLIEKRIP